MTTTAPKFRGKSAVRSAYITVTGSTYGKGNCFTAGALTRHVAMRKYSPEAVFQAINKLEADGVVEFAGQVKSKSGRAGRRYRVLVDRDPGVVTLNSGRTKRTINAPVSEVEVPAEVEVEQTTDPTALEERVAVLESQVQDLLTALRRI
jgi:hypothetical protein